MAPRRSSRSLSASASAVVDPQAGAPEHDDQSAQAIAVSGLAGFAHHGDDLLDPRRIGRVAHPLVGGGRPVW